MLDTLQVFLPCECNVQNSEQLNPAKKPFTRVIQYIYFFVKGKIYFYNTLISL